MEKHCGSMISHGSFIISLDFEMMWGVKDICTPEGYGQTNVKQVREVIERMLALFDKYDVHATFAAVGLLFFKDKTQALKNLPCRLPKYTRRFLSPFEDDYIANIDDRYADLYFASDIIDQLQKHPNIELATHTFSHYNCWADGQTAEDFEADIKAALVAAELFGIKAPKSIVFPRNNVADNYLDICKQYGITTYRGNARRFYARSSNAFVQLFQRFARFVDSYLNIGGPTSVNYNMLEGGEPANVPASRFLRPYNAKIGTFEPLKVRRIKNEILYAARNKELYHLWWHPHNFGSDMEQNLNNLEKILAFYADCHKNYGMQSYTMSEFSNLINR